MRVILQMKMGFKKIQMKFKLIQKMKQKEMILWKTWNKIMNKDQNQIIMKKMAQMMREVNKNYHMVKEWRLTKI